MSIKAISRLVETSETDAKGAAQALGAIFKKHGFDFKITAKPGNPGNMPGKLKVTGKTALGPVVFFVYLSDDQKNLILDWDNFDGITLDTTEFESDLTDLQYLGIPEGTHRYDVTDIKDTLKSLTKGRAKFEKTSTDFLTKLKNLETIQTMFLKATEDIRDVMKTYAVRKVK